jgi:hypothetical protein
MFVGHTAVALAAKSRAPGVSLAWLVAASYMLDLLWPLFVLAGIERVSIVPGATAFNPLVFDWYPWSHSLVMACVWGLVLMLIARRRGIIGVAAWILAALVVSHWVLDFVSHVPDMPLWPGRSPKLGLGLWNSIPATFLVEGAMYVVGIWIYLRTTRPRDRVGVAALWSFLLISTILWASGPWSPPPPSSRALALFALGAWLLVAWAGWADRHREAPTAAMRAGAAAAKPS